MHVPVKAHKPQVTLAHKQPNKSMIHWSRTAWPRHSKVQSPQRGNMAVTPGGSPTAATRAPLQLCGHPEVRLSLASRRRKRKEQQHPAQSLFTQVPIQALHSAPGICGWQRLLLVLCVGVHTGIVLYCYKLDDTGITTDWGPLAWEGKLKKALIPKGGVLLRYCYHEQSEKGHAQPGKEPSCWNFQLV